MPGVLLRQFSGRVHRIGLCLTTCTVVGVNVEAFIGGGLELRVTLTIR